jgi:hypothetical protein
VTRGDSRRREERDASHIGSQRKEHRGHGVKKRAEVKGCQSEGEARDPTRDTGVWGTRRSDATESTGLKTRTTSFFV